MKAGINLDFLNQYGSPPVNIIKQFDSIRLLYNLSMSTGNLDINKSEQIYRNKIVEVLNSGVRVVVVFNHQTYGEERGFNWLNMSSADWNRFIFGNQQQQGFVNTIKQIVSLYKNYGNIIWQIENESNVKPEDARASIPIPSSIYGILFNECYKEIKKINSNFKVITCGLVRGWFEDKKYIQDANITSLDGIGVHVYGLGCNGLFETFGKINNYLIEMSKLNKNLYITEWGVLYQDHLPQTTVSNYIKCFMEICSANAKVMKAIYYAYSSWMDDSYGVIDKNGSTRQNVLDSLAFNYNYTGENNMAIRSSIFKKYEYTSNSNVNFREQPSLSVSNPPLFAISNGDLAWIFYNHTVNASSNIWKPAILFKNGLWNFGWFSWTVAGNESWKEIIEEPNGELPAGLKEDILNANSKLNEAQDFLAQALAKI